MRQRGPNPFPYPTKPPVVNIERDALFVSASKLATSSRYTLSRKMDLHFFLRSNLLKIDSHDRPPPIFRLAKAAHMAQTWRLPSFRVYVLHIEIYREKRLYILINDIAGNTQGAVWIHQIARRHSQAPFRKVKGSVQLVQFHPSKPHFFVAVCDTLSFFLISSKVSLPIS